MRVRGGPRRPFALKSGEGGCQRESRSHSGVATKRLSIEVGAHLMDPLRAARSATAKCGVLPRFELHARSGKRESRFVRVQKPPVEHDVSHEPRAVEQAPGRCRGHPRRNGAREQMRERPNAESLPKMACVRLESVARVTAVRLEKG